MPSAIETRLAALERQAGAGSALRLVLLCGPEGLTPEQQALADEARSNGQDVHIIELVPAEWPGAGAT